MEKDYFIQMLPSEIVFFSSSRTYIAGIVIFTGENKKTATYVNRKVRECIKKEIML